MSAVDELIEEFEDLDEHEACQLLDELGRELPEIPASVYAKENLVPGCQSRVWMVCQIDDERGLQIQADSDAIIVKGLIRVLLSIYVGKTAEEVLAIDHAKIFESLGLQRLITPQRKNGLHSMVQAIRVFAAAHSPEIEIPTQSTASPTPNIDVSITRSIDGIAAEFPIFSQTLPNGNRPVFLDSGASAQKPAAVIEKEREVQQQYYANAFRGRYYFGQRIDDEIERSRSLVANLIGAASTEEIVFTSGTTMSLNMIAHGYAGKFVEPGDEIVITEMEHHANFVPWQMIAARCQAKLRIIPINDAGEIDIESLDQWITPKTALVAVCSMSNVLGTVNPIAKICEMAHDCGAVVVVDAAQSVAHDATSVINEDIDFLTFSGHKLYGPSGVGVLYAKRQLLERMDPMLYGGHMIRSVGRESSTFADPPAKFEAGTMPIVQIIGLGTAIEFVQSIGFDAISEHESKLVVAAHQQLEQIEGLRIFGPPASRKGAIVSFAIEGIATEDLAIRLDRDGVFTRHGHHCAMVLHEKLQVAATTRASLGIYNTLDDIDILAESVRRGVEEIRG